MNIYRVLSGSVTQVIRKDTYGIGNEVPLVKCLTSNPNRIWIQVFGEIVEFQVAITKIANNFASAGGKYCLRKDYSGSFFKE